MRMVYIQSKVFQLALESDEDGDDVVAAGHGLSIHSISFVP